MDRKSIKSVGAGGSGGRRSSSALGPVNSQSLGSNYTSATSGMNNNLTIFFYLNEVQAQKKTRQIK